MKSLVVWYALIVFVLAAITGVGLYRLIDVDLFDAFLSNDHRHRSKRSRIYWQDHPDSLKPEDIIMSLSGIGNHQVKVENNEANSDYPQLSVPTPFPPDHFINQPYFEIKSRLIRDYQQDEELLTDHHQIAQFPSVSKRTTPKHQNLNYLIATKRRKEENPGDSHPSESSKVITRTVLAPKENLKHRKISLSKSFHPSSGYMTQDLHLSRDDGYSPPDHYYHKPPVHYKEKKDLSGVLKAFLLAILIPLGIAIALAIVFFFATFTYRFNNYLYTVVNATNATYFFTNGGYGYYPGYYGGGGGFFQQQQQQQSSSNNNNNNNNNNNAVNASGRAVLDWFTYSIVKPRIFNRN